MLPSSSQHATSTAWFAVWVTTTPETMTAVLLTGYGGFDCLDVRDDVPVPRPGAGEVLVRISAAGVNNTDINTRIGLYAPDLSMLATVGGAAAVATARSDVGWSGNVPTFPRIQGADACGRIVAVGPDVEAGRVGERIIVEPVFRGSRIRRVPSSLPESTLLFPKLVVDFG